ncbi:MAG: polysaccharide biosynthesis/export family protein [Akkermansiaceae bacterium]
MNTAIFYFSKIFLLLTTSLFGLLFLHSCSELNTSGSSTSSQDSTIPSAKVERQPTKPTTLLPGDTLKITYPGASELDSIQKVRVDGKLSLPMVGDVITTGKSVSQLQATLASKYKAHLQNPNVVVTLEATASLIYVSGKVNSPMKVPLDRQLTALEAIMEAGGFSAYGSPKKVSVIRNENGKHKRYNLNLAQALKSEAQAFYLKPFDLVYAY